MLKRIAAVLAGVFSGIIIVYAGDACTHILFPPPSGIDFRDHDQLIQLIANMPTHVFLIMLVFWLLASFTGGFVAGKINKQGWKVSSLITGTILLAATVMNFFIIPHPVWMIIATVLLFLPAAYFGGKIAA